jgi:hypothetical protein
MKHLLALAFLLPLAAHAAGPATTTAPTTLLNTPCAAGVVLVGGGVGLAPGCAGNVTIAGTLGVTGATTFGGGGIYPFQHTTVVSPTTTLTPGLLDGMNVSGTVTSGQSFLREFAINADTLNAPNGAAGLYLGHTISAGAVGGRTELEIYLAQTGETNLAVANSYYVGLGVTAQAAYSAGGTALTPAGDLFGSNPVTQLLTGAGLYWNSVVGEEVDVAVQSGNAVVFKDGFKIVQLIGDAVAGPVGADYAFSIQNQRATPATVGWRTGISFGGYEGWWPIQSTGTLIGTNPANLAGGPSYAASLGVDFSAVTFSTGAFKSTGFLVDGSGNITGNSLGVGQVTVTYAGNNGITVKTPDGDGSIQVLNSSSVSRFALVPQANGGWEMFDYGNAGGNVDITAYKGAVTIGATLTATGYVAGSTAGLTSKTCTISALGATITITGGIVTATSGC